jgi:DNA-binding LacI/PurR family transcriptional regulator
MGEKLTAVTMKTLAHQLGVSVTTVSNAYSKPDRLSTELRDQILATAKELGYCGPSAAGRALRSGKTDVCGYLMHRELTQAFSDPYSVIFLAGLCEGVERFGASVLLLRAPGDEETRTQLFQRAAIDSLVAAGASLDSPVVQPLLQRGVRVVGTQVAPDGDWVAINDGKAGRLVGEHLATLGHQRVVILGSGCDSEDVEEFAYSPDALDPRLKDGMYESERIRGIREKMPDAEIRIVLAPHYSRQSGRDAAAEVLDRPDRPTAIVALSDVLALGVWDAATERGLVPGQDLSITGFDDLPDCAFLGITTVSQPIAEKGRLAGRLAMDPDYPQRQITLPIHLVVRSSTGPAPHL